MTHEPGDDPPEGAEVLDYSAARPREGANAAPLAPGAEPPLTPLDALPAPPSRPPLWPAFVVPIAGLALAALVQAVVFFAMSARLGYITNVRDATQIMDALRAFPRNPIGFAALSASLELVAIAVALLAARIETRGVRARLGLVAPRLPISSWVLLMAASLGFVLVGIVLVVTLQSLHALPEIGADRRAIGEAFDLHATSFAMRAGLTIILLIAGAVLPGLGEEMLFRGYVQRRLLERWKPLSAIALTTLGFALGHGDIAYAAFTIPVGAWLGYLAWRTGSIVPGIVAHTFVNAVFQTLRLGGISNHPTVQFAAGLAIALAISATCAIAMIGRLEQNARSTALPGGA